MPLCHCVADVTLHCISRPRNWLKQKWLLLLSCVSVHVRLCLSILHKSCCVIVLLQTKDTHMFVEEHLDEYFPELLELPGM